MRYIGSFVILIALAGLSFAGYKKYEEVKTQNFVAQLSPSLKNTSLRTTSFLESIIDKNSNMSYIELLQKADSEVKEIEENILEIRTLTNDEHAHISNPAVEYLKNCQKLIRTAQWRTRAQYTAVSVMNRIKIELKQLANTSNPYTIERLNKSTDDLFEKAKKSTEEASSYEAELSGIANELISQNVTLSRTFSPENLLETSLLNQIIVPTNKPKN